MPADDLDTRVRLAAFAFLAEQVSLQGSILSARVLRDGFEFQGQRVRLKGVQGIFKPAILPDLPLSITTAPRDEGRSAPYDDSFTAEGILLYRYRGTDPQHHQNVGLRRAMELGRPLIYFHGIVENSYAAAWPVFVVGDEPNRLRFRVQVDDGQFVSDGLVAVSEATAEARRAYITVTTRRRLHQEGFRIRVLRAYRERCALCRLQHTELLDAAHIIPDRDPLGEPAVTNGLALCKLHHAAFDQNFIGIRPDLVIEVRKDILAEEDGPMLIHGLQGFHAQKLRSLPIRSQERPRPDLLEMRYEQFLISGPS